MGLGAFNILAKLKLADTCRIVTHPLFMNWPQYWIMCVMRCYAVLTTPKKEWQHYPPRTTTLLPTMFVSNRITSSDTCRAWRAMGLPGVLWGHSTTCIESHPITSHPCHAMPCHPTPSHPVLAHSMTCHAMLCHPIPSQAIILHAILPHHLPSHFLPLCPISGHAILPFSRFALVGRIPCSIVPTRQAFGGVFFVCTIACAPKIVSEMVW